MWNFKMLLNGRRCLRRLSCKFIRSGSLSSNKYESMSVSLIDSYQQNSVVQLNGLCSGQLSVLVQSVFSRIDDVSSHKLQAVLDDSLNESNSLVKYFFLLEIIKFYHVRYLLQLWIFFLGLLV